jgi:hypothetical protein
MARYVMISPVTIAAVSYAQPARVLPKGAVVELSAAEVTAVGAGNLRAVSTATQHDLLGESWGVSNSST